MTFLEFTEYVALARDILLVLFSATALVATVVLFWKVSRLVNSGRRMMASVEEVATALSEHFVKRAAASSGVAFGVGKVAAFLLGVLGRKPRAAKGKGGKGDGG